MLVRLRASSPSPFTLPFALAVTTVPFTVDPDGNAGLPPTLIVCASVARKVCPVWLVLELKASPVLTVRTVPAGMTIGLGLGFSTGGAAVVWAVCPDDVP